MRAACLTLALFASSSTHAFQLAFDAVSIKPSPPLDASRGPIFFGPRGGPGTEDPGRYWCNFCNMSELVAQAYDLPEYRIFSGGRLPEDRFHIVAAIPPETTTAQFRIMLQKLLADRFKLSLHHESRDMQMFRLVVAPGGPKAKTHVEGAPAPTDDKEAAATSAPGVYYKVQGKTMADLTKVIENHIHRPVSDATGLSGKYDFDIWWTFSDLTADASAAGDSPTIYSAIQSLGLKLESHKGPLEVIVIDHVEKAPTGN